MKTIKKKKSSLATGETIKDENEFSHLQAENLLIIMTD